MPFASVLYSDAPGLQALAPEWWDLLNRSDNSEPTLTPAWLNAWWAVFGRADGRQLRIFAIYDGDRLVGLAPFLSRPWSYRPALPHRGHSFLSMLVRQLAPYTPGIPFQRLEPLGSGEAEADETCSDYLSVLAEAGREEEVAEEFVSAVVAGVLGRVHELVVPGMDGTKQMTQLVFSAFERHGWDVSRTEQAPAPFVQLPATFDAYVEQLPASGRYLVRRSLRDFAAWAGNDVRWVTACDPGSLEIGKRVLSELHAERWAEDAREGVFASARFAQFHDLVMRELLALGALDLGWLEVRAVPVAALYSFRWRDRSYFYQSGRKMDLPKGVRPGIVIHLYAIRRAIEAGLRVYDFLSGTQQYKLQLATHSRPVIRLRAAPPSLRERSRRFAESGGRRLRELSRDRMTRARAESRDGQEGQGARDPPAARSGASG